MGNHLLCEYVLYREDLIKELELLLGDFLVQIVDSVAIEIVDVLETVHNETLQGLRLQDLILSNDKLLQ